MMVAITGGCTSSDRNTGSSSAAPEDTGGFDSSFATLAGTCVNADDPARSIVPATTGSARIVTGSSGYDTTISRENSVLILADGTGIGPYPVEDGALIYQGVNYQKQS